MKKVLSVVLGNVALYARRVGLRVARKVRQIADHGKGSTALLLSEEPSTMSPLGAVSQLHEAG